MRLLSTLRRTASTPKRLRFSTKGTSMRSYSAEEMMNPKLKGSPVLALTRLKSLTTQPASTSSASASRQRIAVASEKAVLGQRHRLREDALGHPFAKWFQELELGDRWQPLRLHPGAHEVAVVALHAAVPVDAIRPLEVVGERQRLAHANVPERIAAIVENDAVVHAVGRPHDVGFLLEQPPVIAAEIVGRGEGAFVLIAVVVEDAGPESLQHDVHIEKVANHYAVEVVLTDVHVEVPAPNVFRLPHERFVEMRADSRIQGDPHQSLVDIGVHVVERADDGHSDRAAFRRIRIRIVEARHVLRVLQVAEVREAVARTPPPIRGREGASGSRQRNALATPPPDRLVFRQVQRCECSCEGFLVPGEARRRGVAGSTQGGVTKSRGQKDPQIPVDLGLTEH